MLTIVTIVSSISKNEISPKSFFDSMYADWVWWYLYCTVIVIITIYIISNINYVNSVSEYERFFVCLGIAVVVMVLSNIMYFVGSIVFSSVFFAIEGVNTSFEYWYLFFGCVVGIYCVMFGAIFGVIVRRRSVSILVGFVVFVVGGMFSNLLYYSQGFAVVLPWVGVYLIRLVLYPNILDGIDSEGIIRVVGYYAGFWMLILWSILLLGACIVVLILRSKRGRERGDGGEDDNLTSVLLTLL
jgi:hypothetical protein